MNMQKLMIWCVTIFALTLSGRVAAEPAPLPAFKSPEEAVEGWYHRHEHDSWVRNGADLEVVQGILHRIETTEGERADPDLIDSIVEFGPGNWVFEWNAEGERAMERGRALAAQKDQGEAYKAYREALVYFTVASWPHLGLKDDRAALANAREAYMAAGRYFEVPVQHVSFPVGERVGKGYLHLPPGEGPHPLLVFTFGSDVTKEDALSFFDNELEAAGIALLAVDLPGIGEASHIPLREGSDAMLAAGYAYAAGLDVVDGDRIYVAGGSFGGNAAARFFLNIVEPDSTTANVAGVVSMCGPLHRPFVAPPEVLDALPALTIDGVKSRLGMLGATSVELREVTPVLSVKPISEQRGEIQTPLMILTTNNDPVAPLEDLELLEGHATELRKAVIDMVGHCPPRWLRQPLIRRWIEDLER